MASSSLLTTRPAVIVLMLDNAKVPRLAPAQVLRILARHGVPTRR